MTDDNDEASPTGEAGYQSYQNNGDGPVTTQPSTEQSQTPQSTAIPLGPT